MKLISLNTWGGMRFETLMEFIKTQAADTDIFCFQEVFDTSTDRTTSGQRKVARVNLLSELKQLLPDFDGFFVSVQDGKDMDIVGDMSSPPRLVDFDLRFGNAIFVRKTIAVSDQGEFWVYRHKNAMISNDVTELGSAVQYVKFVSSGKTFMVCNFHGLLIHGESKSDVPERIEQCSIIKKFLDSTPGEKILCGDFNMRPETKSLAMLCEGMRNLISESNIKTTRSELYADRDKYQDYISDYTLVSPGIKVQDFQVPHLLASDHLPMSLKFN